MHSVIKMTEYKTVKLLATYFTEKYLNDLRPGNKFRDIRAYTFPEGFYSSNESPKQLIYTSKGA